MRVKKTVGNKDKEKVIEEITQETVVSQRYTASEAVIQEITAEIERLVNDPEERKKTEEFVRKVSYLSPKDLIIIFDI